MFVGSMVAAPGVASPMDDTVAASLTPQEALAWTETLPVPELAQAAQAHVLESGGTRVPPPSSIAGYSGLDEATQRVAWRAWLLRTSIDRATDPMPHRFPQLLGAGADADLQGGAEASLRDETLRTPRGLTQAWDLEAHGWPSEVIAADPQGGNFVVTDIGIVRFGPETGILWMYKPDGYVSHAMGVDANGAGSTDIVLGITSFQTGAEVPSIAVLDGDTGRLLFSGFSGERRLWAWSLTDVDADGTQDLLGLDADDHLVAAQLDGTEIYRNALPIRPSESLNAPVALVMLAYLPATDGLFADVDGDGILDVVMTSGYMAFALVIAAAGLALADTSLDFVTAFRGVDGREIWSVPSHPGSGWQAPFVLGAGDLNGDGKDDPLLGAYAMSYASASVAVAFQYLFVYVEGYAVLNGVDGRDLMRDAATEVRGFGFPASIPSVSSGEIPYEPVAVVDLDGDGATEIVAITESAGAADVVGLGMGMVVGGPSEELYRHELLRWGPGDIDGNLMLRDTDGDGNPELVVFLIAANEGDDGLLDSLETRIVVVNGGDVKSRTAPDLLLRYDVAGPDGQAYGLRAQDSRWVPLGADLRATSNGSRFLPEIRSLVQRDANADGAKDVLLSSIGVASWVNGKTGGLIREAARPLTRYILSSGEEAAGARLLEMDMTTADLHLVDVETGADLWTIDAASMEDFSFASLADFTGDGRLDVAMSTVRETTRSVEIRDPANGATAQTFSFESTVSPSFRYEDVDPARPGHEVVVRTREDSHYWLSLFVTTSDEPVWKHDLGASGSYLGSGDGYLLVRFDPEGDAPQPFHVVNAKTGATNATVDVSKGENLANAVLRRMNPDAFPELVQLLYMNQPGSNDPTYYVRTQDWHGQALLSNFTTTGTYASESASGFTLQVGPPSLTTAVAVGDWDLDGIGDVLLREQQLPTVRSGATGALLAVFPGVADVRGAFDVLGDTRAELLVVEYDHRMALYAYEAGAVGDPDPDGGDGLISDPEELETSIPLPGKRKGFLPGFDALFAIAVVAVVVLGRRRP